MAEESVERYEDKIDIFAAVFAEFEPDRAVLEIFQEERVEQSVL
jgi:hypothetical protein